METVDEPADAQRAVFSSVPKITEIANKIFRP